MSFKIKNVNLEGHVIPLIKETTNDSNVITIIIGKNGTGKSRILSAITRTFQAFENLDFILHSERSTVSNKRRLLNNFSMSFQNSSKAFNVTVEKGQLNTYNSDISDYLPNKIIATSNSPFDKFPIELTHKNQFHIDDFRRYKYLGTKNKMGQHSTTYQLSKVIDSLFLASTKTLDELGQLSKIFNFLGYQERIKVHYRYRPQLKRLMKIDSFEEGFEHLQQFSRIRLAMRNNRIKNDDVEDIIIACKDAFSYSHGRSIHNFELDFLSGGFITGSLEQFERTSILREIELMELKDVTLINSTTGEEFSIRETSSGEQCFLSLILGIASEITDNSLICIDEPEISLHPEWQEQIIQIISDTFSSYNGCHFIIATHSPQIISNLSTKNCFVLTLDDYVLHDTIEFFKKSSDFQLANLFKTPGFGNEYLNRECVNILTSLSKSRSKTKEELDNAAIILQFLPLLSDMDPVKELLLLIEEVLEKLNDK